MPGSCFVLFGSVGQPFGQAELCDLMDIFSVVTSACRSEYTHQTKHVKSPAEGLRRAISKTSGDWDSEMLAIIRATFYVSGNIHKIGGTTPSERASRNMDRSASFAFHLLTERATRLMAEMIGYPQRVAPILSADR